MSEWDKTYAARWQRAFGVECPPVRNDLTEADVTSEWRDHVRAAGQPVSELVEQRRAQAEALTVSRWQKNMSGRVISGTTGEILDELRRRDPQLAMIRDELLRGQEEERQRQQTETQVSYTPGIAVREMTPGSGFTYRGDPKIVALAQERDHEAAARLANVSGLAASHHVGPPT